MPDLSNVIASLLFAHLAVAGGIIMAIAVRMRFLRQSRRLAAWRAWLPVLTMTSLLLLSLSPHPLREPEHALHRDWHHRTEGLIHIPGLHTTAHTLTGLFLAYAGIALVWMAFTAGKLRAIARMIQRMPARPQNWNGHPFLLLDSPRPICFTLGVFRPRIYVSSALLERLSPQHSDAMFAHEAAHLRRRDGLTGALLTLFYCLFPFPGSGTLRRDWLYHAERACDTEAARQVGDPNAVAEALIEVTRLAQHPSLSGIACFAAHDHIEERVTALIASQAKPEASSHRVSVFIAISLWLIGVLATDVAIRHLIELLVHH